MGIELISRIRERAPEARIILLSSLAEALGLTPQNTGADAVIAKTHDEQGRLLRWVKRLLNRSALRKPPEADGELSQ